MADWTANSSGFSSRDATRELMLRNPREAAETQATAALRAERAFGAEEAQPRAAFRLTEYNSRQNGALAKARIALWIGGGIVSLLLIAGVGVWGYKLVLRDVLGLPVVVAAEGPMRVLPADPEGEIVPSQGLAVNAIPAVGTVASTSDILVLAPQTPDLADEDMEVVQTMAEAGEVVPTSLAEPVTATVVEFPAQSGAVSPLTLALAAPVVAAAPVDFLEVAEGSPLAPVAATSAAPAEEIQPAQLAVAPVPPGQAMTTQEILAFDQITAGAEPLSPTPPATPTPLEIARPTITVLPPEVPGVASSLKPVARPDILTSTPPAEVAPPVATSPAPRSMIAESQVAVASTAAVPSGTHLVQLGAFDSPEIAASEWGRLQDRFHDFLGARDHIVQQTQSGGRTLYRLRALGFPERADARILCAALTAEGADCIPVTVD